jgi:hypothetical protein
MQTVIFLGIFGHGSHPLRQLFERPLLLKRALVLE